MRIFVTGMGGELGTRVTRLLEERNQVDEILGIDGDPPRRRLQRAGFTRVDFRDRRRLVSVVEEFDPHVMVHLGVMEPHARFSPRIAESGTRMVSLAVLGAAARCPSLESIVVRSGLEVYGRPRGAPFRPDETIAPRPTSPFGHSLLGVEELAAHAADAASVPATTLRLASVVGPHFPSPLGRLLRLPLVPVDPLSDLPFSLLHQEDAAAAILAAIDRRYDGPVNIVGPGVVTASQAARMGGRAAIPVFGPGWWAARGVAEVLSAPLPAHVKELLARGRTADGARAASALGFSPSRSTRHVVEELYEWASVTYLHVADEAA
ncbi:MAG: NAD-dependent epimerase/dehydratase family protein [Acidimicrobiales bacterium]